MKTGQWRDKEASLGKKNILFSFWKFSNNKEVQQRSWSPGPKITKSTFLGRFLTFSVLSVLRNIELYTDKKSG